MASSYDSHVVKRQKTDDGVVSPCLQNHSTCLTWSFREPAQDRHNPEVSPVVHVRGVPDHAFEEDIVSAVQHFGTVQYCMILRGRRQALVEFSDTKGSSACVNFANSNQLCIAGTPAFFNFSTSQRIQRPRNENNQSQGQMGENGRPYQNVPGNKILLFTVLNAKYPITVDVMHTICSSHGRVEKIVIFRKQYVQAQVTFENLEASKSAKDQLQGCDIYSGCCTLRVEYAKTDELNVRANNSDSWDYTQPSQSDNAPRKGAPLLADPRFTAQPTPFEGRTSEYDDYGGDQQGYFQQKGYEAEGAYQGFGAPAVSRGMTSPQGRGMGGMGRGGMVSMGRGRGGAQGGYGEVSGYGGRGALQETPGYGAYADPQAADSFPQGCVLMIYGLSAAHMNCDRVFNLFCLYGNVVRVKFLKTKEGSAMIQMGDSSSVERAIFNLNGVFAFESKLVVTLSKQPYLQVVNNPHDLPDGTCSYKDFSSNSNNRFRNQEQAAKNRIIHTTEILHFFNAPPTITEDQIKQVFEEAGAKLPKKILQFPVKSGKSSSGLAEWENKQDSVEALILTNHVPVDNPEGGRPYYIKLCFSPSSIRETN
ncbi:heterogeneous nuclear ribonucleoprotein L-like isoform X2 [Dreissena polymorpha]|uniref:heterogeneous nuclear ribonucleoprotein L-like isoform X2 n=1 Tax=Dreissena polymorpha TaxID=45954 RepID=UPI0022651AAA|nr:heterogeneous nuclear ribonucleoprotein L-like isoform X2 [Dreissena polymorpha]